jgi:predicted nucleotidyltransferase
MSKTMDLKIEDIKNFLEKLLQGRGISINKIVLFGSFIRGGFGKESDVDIIIVSKDFRDRSMFERVKKTTGIGRELVKRFQIPFDLIFYSDEEWEKKSFLLINEAKEKGRVIYG